MSRYRRKGVGRKEAVSAPSSECEYHACDYIGPTSQCTYCKHNFCPTHLQPKPPSTVHISTASYQELQSWNNEDAHPCIAYVDEYKQKQEAELNAAKESLDRMKNSGHSWARSSYEQPRYERRNEENQSYRKYTRSPHSYETSASSPQKPSGNFDNSIRYWAKKLFQLFLFPFVWAYNTILAIFDCLIVKPMRWLYEEASNFLYHLTKGVRHFLNAVWALAKIAIFLAVAYLVISFIWSSGILTDGAAALSGIRVPAPFAKNCTVTLQSGECSSPKPFYCDDGKIVRRSDICGCPEGWRPNATDCTYAFPCQDGTLTPDCSDKKPYQCAQGQLVENASLCGCPDDYKAQNDTCIKIQRCDDRTIYGECSTNQPLFCDNGVLIERATQCGCPDFSNYEIIGENCRFISPEEKQDRLLSTTEDESKAAINYLNTLRTSNGKSTIQFDERAYKLGLARSKDMYVNHYLDHTSPSGACPWNMKSNYGFSSFEDVAENGAAGGAWPNSNPPTAVNTPDGRTFYYDYIDFISSKPNLNQVIDGWMESRGHRYNLLFDYHTGGALSCYGGACVFLGVNTQGFAAGCYYAEDTMPMWHTLPLQPGEVSQ